MDHYKFADPEYYEAMDNEAFSRDHITEAFAATGVDHFYDDEFVVEGASYESREDFEDIPF